VSAVDWFFYDAPIWFSLPTFVLLAVGVSWAILLAVRPWVIRTAGTQTDWDRVLGYAMQSYGILFGIVLALIAVSVYENFQRVNAVVLDEASVLGALFRDVAGYPTPLAEQLQEELRRYVQGVITIDWPLMQQDIIPAEGNVHVDSVRDLLFGFDPVTTGQQAMHAQTIDTFNDFMITRRARLDETKLALPALMWVVLAVGAVLNALMISLVESKSLRIHLIMSGIIAIFVALVIYTTAGMDHPYAGYVSITPEAFENLLGQLMAP
jgi:hypothetical protein